MFTFKALQKNRVFKYGLPMLVLVLGGSFGLREFTQIRYDEQLLNRKIDPELEAILNGQKNKKKKKSLEEEYEEMKSLNLDEWQNIRGPRPWEDSKEYQDQQRAKLSKTI